MSYSVPAASATRRAEQVGLVRDNRGYPYVALHPGYTCRRTVRHTVYAFRLVVCFLSFLVLLFAVVGQCVPFCQEGKPGSDQEKYTVWQVKEYDKKPSKPVETEYNDKTQGAQVFAILTLFFALVAFVLSAIFASCWQQAERARRDEEDANYRLQAKYGTERTGSQESDDTAFPYENARIVNDRVAYIPFEDAERRRRRQDRDMGIALFSMLIAAAVCALITLILMSDFRSNNIKAKNYPKYLSGLALFIVALIMAVVAFVLVAIPPATRLYLCFSPAVTPADLMVLDHSLRGDEDNEEAAEEDSRVRTQPAPRAAAGDREKRTSSKQKQRQRASSSDGHVGYPQEQRQGTNHDSAYPAPPSGPPAAQMQAATNPYYPPTLGDGGNNNNTNMTVAQGIPMALPGPPMEALQQHQQQQASGYTSGTYYEAPPQLFNVNNNNSGGKGGKGKSV